MAVDILYLLTEFEQDIRPSWRKSPED